MTLAQQIAEQEEAEAEAADQNASPAKNLRSEEVAALRSFFVPGSSHTTAYLPRTALYDSVDIAPPTIELGLLGHSMDADCSTANKELYLNVTDPFCLITVGVQGAGK